MNRENRLIPGGIFAATVALCLLPLVGVSEFYMRIIGFILINMIVVCGLVVLYGYCDQVSLATGAFFGIGAYSVSYISTKTSLGVIAGLVIAVALASCIGFLIALPANRLASHYLAMATLGFSQLVLFGFIELTGITGGVDGMVSKSFGELGFGLSDTTGAHIVITIIAMCVLLATRNLINGAPGRAMSAVGQDEKGARASGVLVEPIKIRAYVYSAGLAALGGGLYAALVGFISPQLFGPALSIMYLAMAAIGGRESLLGPLMAAFMITLVQYASMIIPGLSPVAREFVSSSQIELYGLAIVLCTLFVPQGLKSLWRQRLKRGGQ